MKWSWPCSRDAIYGIERAKDVFVISLSQERAQEDRRQELALAVDAHVKQVLRVVFEFDPRTAIGNDLREEVGIVLGFLEEDAGRPVELRDDDALGAVDDEGAVVGHQRKVAEDRLLLP